MYSHPGAAPSPHTRETAGEDMVISRRGRGDASPRWPMRSLPGGPCRDTPAGGTTGSLHAHDGSCPLPASTGVRFLPGVHEHLLAQSRGPGLDPELVVGRDNDLKRAAVTQHFELQPIGRFPLEKPQARLGTGIAKVTNDLPHILQVLRGKFRVSHCWRLGRRGHHGRWGTFHPAAVRSANQLACRRHDGRRE